MGLFYYPIKSCAEVQCVELNDSLLSPPKLHHFRHHHRHRRRRHGRHARCTPDAHTPPDDPQTQAKSAMACARGFVGDRMFQVTDSEGRFCTPREAPKKKLFHVRPTLSKDQAKLTLQMDGQSDLVVDMKKAKKMDVEVEVLCAKEKQAMFDFGDEPAKWLANATEIEGCRLSGYIGAKQYVRTVQYNQKQADKVPEPGAAMSLADEAPYLLTSTSSLADLNVRLEKRGAKPVDMRRFRPNIVISGFKVFHRPGGPTLPIPINPTPTPYAPRATLYSSYSPLDPNGFTLRSHPSRYHPHSAMGGGHHQKVPYRPGGALGGVLGVAALWTLRDDHH